MSENITAPVISPTPRERVEKGAAWLDEVKPEWRHEINTNELRMYSPRSCVLGQVFSTEAYEAGTSNGYSHAFTLTGTHDYRWMTDHGYKWMIDHGFEVAQESYEELAEAWLRYLLALA
jgi:hypothetical protein